MVVAAGGRLAVEERTWRGGCVAGSWCVYNAEAAVGIAVAAVGAKDAETQAVWGSFAAPDSPVGPRTYKQNIHFI